MTSKELATDGSWALGTLIWPPVALILTIACVVLAALLFAHARREKGKKYGDRGFALFLGSTCAVFAACLIVGTAWGMYPYSAEYHQWREVSGTVQQIDKRLIGSDGKMEDKFVVRFAEDGQQFGCDDTRCASVREGDDLTLSCKRAWQYTGTDGYDCRFVSTEATR